MSSSSTDTENEDKEEKMKQLAKLKIRQRKKRKSKQMKKSKTNMPMISMSSTDLRRISNSKSEERPKNLRELLIEYLKENKYMEDIKAKLEKKEEQKIEELCHKYNEYGSKADIKERRHQPKKNNEKQNIPLSRKPLKKRNKKGIDRNGNHLKSNPNVASMVVQPKIQPTLDIDHIVEKCANEFKTSIKSAIVELANSVIEPDSVNNDGIDKSQTKQSEPFESTNDEILKPYSDTSTDCENSDVTQHEDFETQENKFFKISLEKERNNLYRIDKERFQKSRLREKNKLDKDLGKVTDKKWDKLIEKRYQNLEMGRKIFENAYRFYENSDDDENNEFEQNKITGAKDVVFKRRRNIPSRNLKRSKKTEETFVPSREKKTEAENLGMYVNVEMVRPRDIYLSSLPQYSEYRTEVHVPKSCIEDNHTTVDHSERSVNEDMSSQTSDEEIGEEKSQLPVERHVAEFSVKTEVFSDDETTKNIKTEYTDERPKESKVNVMEKIITDYISSIREKFENDENGENKKKYTKKKRSYQDLERERIKCQKKVNRELEYFKRLTEQQYSKISSTEDADDEAFERSKKTVTEVSGRAKKRKFHETKRSTSPIFVYHYYRPNIKFNENTTFYDSDGSVPNFQSFQVPFYPLRELRTPPPLGISNYEATEQISEERKSIRRSVDCLPSTSENGENSSKQLEMEEETLDAIQNSKLKTSNDKLKIHYQPMKITFDARSITNSKL